MSSTTYNESMCKRCGAMITLIYDPQEYKWGQRNRAVFCPDCGALVYKEDQMSSTTYSESVCDRCGVVTRRTGGNWQAPPDGWVFLTLQFGAQANEHGWGDRANELLCPECAMAIKAALIN